METFTFLFTDIEGSTALLGRLGEGLYGQVLADHHRDLADPADSETLFAEAIACTQRSGDHLFASYLHNNASIHALRAGNISAAQAHLEQAEHAQQMIGAGSDLMSVNLGWVRRQDSDPDGARASFKAALRRSRRDGDRTGTAYASLGLACLAADTGDWHRAAVLHGVAQVLLDRTGQPWEELEARYRRDSLDQVRAHLGQEQFEQALARGLALSSDEALDLASGKPAQPDLLA